MRFLTLTGGLLTILSLTACAGSRQPQPDVEKLSRTVPILQQFQVENFRNQDWCKTIAYQQSVFSNNQESRACNLSGKARPFTEQANQDFAQVAAAIQQTDVPLYAISVKYGPNQTIRRAEFSLTSGGGYVYEPSYAKLPADLPNEREYKAVNQDWYAFWQDWN